MPALLFKRLAATALAVFPFLTGCLGSQPPVLSGGSQPVQTQTHKMDGGSWMLPEAKGEDLLYVSTGQTLYALHYPEGKVVGEVAVEGTNLCADAKGRVFLTEFGTHRILEYRHGEVTRSATLSDPGDPWNCSVDPLTGNLAVANMATGNIAIFPGGKGPAYTVTDPTLQYPAYCTFDNAGNLFVQGVGFGKGVLTELRSGSSSFTDLGVSQHWYGSAEIQWGGKHLAVADPIAHTIYRVAIVGQSGVVVGTTKPDGWYKGAFAEVWLQGNTFIAQAGLRRELTLWPYPAGGKPKSSLSGFARREEISGVTVSLAPK